MVKVTIHAPEKGEGAHEHIFAGMLVKCVVESLMKAGEMQAARKFMGAVQEIKEADKSKSRDFDFMLEVAGRFVDITIVRASNGHILKEVIIGLVESHTIPENAEEAAEIIQQVRAIDDSEEMELQMMLMSLHSSIKTLEAAKAVFTLLQGLAGKDSKGPDEEHDCENCEAAELCKHLNSGRTLKDSQLH